NQALMELGSQICTITSPKCKECPLAHACVARSKNLQAKIPLRAAPPAGVEIREVAVVVRKGRRGLLGQCPERGRWAGMWEFPRGELRPAEGLRRGGRRVLFELTGIQAGACDELLVVKHTVTRFRITLTGLEAHYRSGKFRSAHYLAGKWVLPEDL